MKIEHGIIIVLLLILIFLQAKKSGYPENPSKTTVSSTSSLGFYNKSGNAPTYGSS
jgi:hypothetical protein